MKAVLKGLLICAAGMAMPLSTAPASAQMSPAQLKAQRDRAGLEAAARAKAERERAAAKARAKAKADAEKQRAENLRASLAAGGLRISEPQGVVCGLESAKRTGSRLSWLSTYSSKRTGISYRFNFHLFGKDGNGYRDFMKGSPQVGLQFFLNGIELPITDLGFNKISEDGKMWYLNVFTPITIQSKNLLRNINSIMVTKNDNILYSSHFPINAQGRLALSSCLSGAEAFILTQTKFDY